MVGELRSTRFRSTSAVWRGPSFRERQRTQVERQARSALALRLGRRDENEHYEPMKASAASTFEPSDSTLSIVTRGSADEGPVHAAYPSRLCSTARHVVSSRC